MPTPRSTSRFRLSWALATASLTLLASCSAPRNGHIPSAAALLPDATVYPLEANLLAEHIEPETRFLIVTFFDLYCVACQQSADAFVTLGNTLDKRPDHDAIVPLGIGLGDTAFEVQAFLRTYPLSYPCLADPEKTWQAPFDLQGTPTVLTLAVEKDGLREILRHQGRFRNDDIAELLAEIEKYQQARNRTP